MEKLVFDLGTDLKAGIVSKDKVVWFYCEKPVNVRGIWATKLNPGLYIYKKICLIVVENKKCVCDKC